MAHIAINYYPERLDPPRRGDFVFQTSNLKTLKLTDGINIFKDYDLKELKKHRRFKSLEALGAIVVTEKVEPKEQILPTNINAIKNVGDVRTIIKTCHDVEQLKAFLEQEKEGKGRSTILSLIDERINALEQETLLNATIVASN